jgi:hypothetical protein
MTNLKTCFFIRRRFSYAVSGPAGMPNIKIKHTTMIKIFRTFSLLTLFLVASLSLNAQCKAFAKKTCLPELGGYTHDGNYHAAILAEGEEAELFKTFYSDMEYRMAICGEETLKQIEFTVYDASNNILYSSKETSDAKTWDFRLQSSQQLRIMISVGSSGGSGTTPASGCVSIMFGFKIKQ